MSSALWEAEIGAETRPNAPARLHQDAPSFDDEYDSLPLDHFVPMMSRVFANKPFWDDPTNLKAGTVVGDA